MTDGLLIGIDIGTTGVKVVVVDPGRGQIAQATRANRLSSPHAGWAEADPAQWFANVESALLELASAIAGRAVAAIATTGMVPAIVAVDAAGAPVRAAILQNDARATGEVEALTGRLVMSGVTARAAIADSWGAAHALARYAADPLFVTPPGETIPGLAPLPLQALRLPPAIAAGLNDLGFVRIGDLIGQPRAPLTRRFGPELCRRLDQALGEIAEPIEPIRPEELVSVRRVFAEPIGAAETIARYIRKLVMALCEALEGRGLGARRLDLLCHRVDNRIETVRIGLAMPVRDSARLTRLLCDRIETIAPGFGIEIMTLAATLAEPLEPRQVVSSLVEDSDVDVSALVDILANRVGERAGAADVAARLRRVRALPRSGELGDDDLVDERDVRLDVEDLGGQLGRAGLRALRAKDVDRRHVRLPWQPCGRGRCRRGGRGRHP